MERSRTSSISVAVPAKATRSLAEIERDIAFELQAPFRLGQLLIEVQKTKGYAASYGGTFESYVERRWNIKSRKAHRLIAWVRGEEIVRPIGHIANEAIARELTPLISEPQKYRQVYKEAVRLSGGREPTALAAATARKSLFSAKKIVERPKPTKALSRREQKLRTEEIACLFTYFSKAARSIDNLGIESLEDFIGSNKGNVAASLFEKRTAKRLPAFVRALLRFLDANKYFV